jgi:hypothetical protein
MVPVRMVMVTASFPYKEELERFRQALRRRSLNELLNLLRSNEAFWRFTALEIQRQVLTPDGRVKTPWEDYTSQLRQPVEFLLRRVGEGEPDDQKLTNFEGIIVKGLAMPRLPLAKGQYPELDIPGIKETVATMEKLGHEKVDLPKSLASSKLSNEGTFDVFDPKAEFEQIEEAKPENKIDNKTADDKKTKEGAEDEQEVVVPEKSLVRFYDLTVQPGLTYEYRLKVKMANPNLGQTKTVAYAALAKEKEIKAENWTVTPKVTVPHDVSWYATDERPDRDKAKVEIHRWVDSLLADPERKESEHVVADWVVLDKEKASAHRGEYLGHTVDVEVPSWNAEQESYELLMNPKTRSRRVPVDFSARISQAMEPAILVDYDGGKVTQTIAKQQVTDELPARILVLTPEGKLVVHYAFEDIKDKEREERVKAWKEEIDAIKKGKKTGAGKPEKGGNEFFDRGRGMVPRGDK